jgi:hypothetical protein
MYAIQVIALPLVCGHPHVHSKVCDPSSNCQPDLCGNESAIHTACAMCTHASQIITRPTGLSFAAIRICIPQCMCKLYACGPGNYQTDLHLVCGYPHLQPTLCNLHACGPCNYQTDLHFVRGYPRLHPAVFVQFACMRPR